MRNKERNLLTDIVLLFDAKKKYEEMLDRDLNREEILYFNKLFQDLKADIKKFSNK